MKTIYKIFAFILTLFASYLYPQQDTTITFTEVMFYAPSGNNEFIELFNLSYTTPANLSGWAIKYYTSNPDTIVNAGFGTVLPPRSYAIIFEGDYSLDTGIYAGRVPPEALKLKIKDNAFGTNGMANTSDRTLILLSTSGATDTYTYTVAGNSSGISDEKINLFFDPISANWGNSRVYLGTPGYTNSIAPLARDGAVTKLNIYPNPASILDDPVLTVTVKNLGLLDINNAYLYIYYDINNDSVISGNELLYDINYQFLAPGDSASKQKYLPALTPGKHRFFAIFSVEEDDNPENNIAVTVLEVLRPPLNYNEIVINEIMYAPSGGAPEWIELLNNTDSVINLKRWRISDRIQSSSLPDRDLFINGKGYFVIADDSTFFNYFQGVKNVVVINLPSLNNDADAITLKDSYGYQVDSIFYRSTWGGTSGKSLERILPTDPTLDSTNWKSARTYATPGSMNSVSPKQYDIQVAAVQSIPTNPHRLDTVSINVYVNNLGSSGALFDLLVYDDLNKDSIPDILLSQSSLKFLAAGTSAVEYFPDLIPHITNDHQLIIKAVFPADQDSTNNKLISLIRVNTNYNNVVVNEVMYSPAGGAPEWIELFNRSGFSLNLRKWKIGDASQSVTLPDRDILVPLYNMLVIADDSSFFKYFPGTQNVVIANLPSLNNDGDAVVVMDSLGRIADSLYYFPSWGGRDGRSLERIDTEVKTLDSTNWKTSRVSATPGYINTASPKIFDLSLESGRTAPAYPSYGDSVSLTVLCKNLGATSVSFNIFVYSDVNRDSIPDQLIAQSLNISIITGDSLLINFNNIIAPLVYQQNLIIRAVYGPDQDTTNNTIIFPLLLYTPTAAVKVNEIMYAPAEGMPEWIELYNLTNLPVDISGWRVFDVFSAPASVTIPPNTTISAFGYLVIADDSSITKYFRENNYPLVVANFPYLNNDQDGVVLKDNYDRVIDSVFYASSYGGSKGLAIERVDPALPAGPSNWRETIYREKGTPGRINSVTPKMIDGEVSSIQIVPPFPDLNQEISLNVTIRNNGFSAAASGMLHISLFSETNLIYADTVSFSSLTAKDSIIINTKKETFRGRLKATALLILPGDADSYNNYLDVWFLPGSESKRIIISEVMYSPAAGEKEWIELYNNSDKPIQLSGWTLGSITFVGESDIIPAKSYILVTADTNLSNKYSRQLNYLPYNVTGLSERKTIVLRDHRGAPIDSFFIEASPSVYNRRSLEKIYSPDTGDFYHPSIDTLKATPGIVNSIASANRNKKGVVFNEIMFDTDNDKAEYIEVYNHSRDTVDAAWFKISVNNSSSFTLSPDTRYFLPGDYFVVANDSAFYNAFPDLSGNKSVVVTPNAFSLTNSGAEIKLTNIFSDQCDTASYSPGWYGKLYGAIRNRSLEKINPLLPGIQQNNWAGTADLSGGTPGKINSVYTGLITSSSELSVSPNPFSPDYDGFEDHTIINYNLSNASNLVTVKIFDGSGREVRTLLDSSPSGASGSISFDGFDNSGKPLPIGIYIIYLEAHGTTGNFNQKLKTVVVSARKL